MIDLRPRTPLTARPRRLRETEPIRSLLRETRLAARELVAPLFVVPGRGRREPIASLPGQARLSPDLVVEEAAELSALGVGGVLLFGVTDVRDDLGRSAADPDGPVPQALDRLRGERLPIVAMADVCLCDYTTHGHCGILRGDRVDNDLTLPALADAAVAYAAAGAAVVAPSAMMDGQVAALRTGLDRAGHADVAIMSYAAKHASSLYGPFRQAAASTPAFGDRRSYQMEAANGREALREMRLDADEGADVLMVKPALTSLDVLARARARFDLPLAAYQVSGEYAMVHAAADRGWVDRRAAVLETLTAIRRAGADLVITYFARDAAAWLGRRDLP
ncbi:MAG TPA: porphobilinogen synthase [Candidatus Dormibacteraeota bacterium]|jgi:porphobilinogen synthase